MGTCRLFEQYALPIQRQNGITQISCNRHAPAHNGVAIFGCDFCLMTGVIRRTIHGRQQFVRRATEGSGSTAVDDYIGVSVDGVRSCVANAILLAHVHNLLCCLQSLCRCSTSAVNSS